MAFHTSCSTWYSPLLEPLPPPAPRTAAVKQPPSTPGLAPLLGPLLFQVHRLHKAAQHFAYGGTAAATCDKYSIVQNGVNVTTVPMQDASTLKELRTALASRASAEVCALSWLNPIAPTRTVSVVSGGDPTPPSWQPWG